MGTTLNYGLLDRYMVSTWIYLLSNWDWILWSHGEGVWERYQGSYRGCYCRIHMKLTMALIFDQFPSHDISSNILIQCARAITDFGIYVDSSQHDELGALYLQKLSYKIYYESKLIKYISTVSTNYDGKFFDMLS